MNRELIITHTDDGSPTIYVPEIDEHYHSTHGAIQESLHIFVNAGLNHRISSVTDSKNIIVFEVGFGTGLNAALTATRCAELPINIIYHTVELYPLSQDITNTLSSGIPMQEATLWNAIHQAEWNTSPTRITPTFEIVKYWADMRNMQLPNGIDIVYFDAFSPEKEATLWEENIFKALYDKMNNGGVLTTYCAKGEIRRRLTRCGFSVERLAGPPGKREILRATKVVSNLKSIIAVR